MSIKSIYLFGSLIVTSILVTSISLQYIDHLEPCPLCILQRTMFGLFALLFFIGIFIHSYRTCRIITNFLSLVTAFIGIIFAARQVWLQFFPSTSNAECGASIRYMLDVLSWDEIATKIFSGSAECTQRGWELFHLNMAEWSLILFIILFLLAGYLLKKG